jgi:hypothetical protein
LGTFPRLEQPFLNLQTVATRTTGIHGGLLADIPVWERFLSD